MAHLRSPAELAMFTGDAGSPSDIGGGPVVFGLRWRAVDPCDYHIPFSAVVDDLPASRARAARYPVDSLARRTRHATWRGAAWTVVLSDGEWLRLRLCRPGPESTPTLGTQCVERGLYEHWAPAAEVMDIRDVDVAYDLDASPQTTLPVL